MKNATLSGLIILSTAVLWAANESAGYSAGMMLGTIVKILSLAAVVYGIIVWFNKKK